MFGTSRLKSWMEALGTRKPRQKSGHHQNQKSHRQALKEAAATAASAPDVGGSCSTNATTTTVTSGTTSGALSSSSNGNSVEYNNLREQPLLDSCYNLDSSASTDFSQACTTQQHQGSTNTNSNNAPSSSNVQIQSDSVVVGLAQSGSGAQIQKQASANHSTKDYEDEEDEDEEEEKAEEQEEENHHHQKGTTSCTRSSTTGSVSNSTSHNILLGSSFCNNLSSPDTGYSTDGYSPKSVYPALSFENSGKSTPKSSYTISSLVSSELHLSSSKGGGGEGGNTASLSSASCSVNNGLESDHEFPSPTPRVQLKTSASLPPDHSEITIDNRSNNLGLGDGRHIINEKRRISQDSSPHRHGGGEETRHSHSINQNKTESTRQPLDSCTTQDSYRGNDKPTVSDTQCNSTKSSVSSHPPHKEFFSSHQQLPSTTTTTCTTGESGSESSMVAAKQPLSNFTSQSIRQEYSNNNASCNGNNPNSEHNINFSNHKSTNPFCGNQIQNCPSSATSTTTSDNNRRTERLDHDGGCDERKSSSSSSVLTNPSPDSSSEGNTSSLLTASSGNRNIRTSFILATSQIQECNSFGLKNSFSICSPSKRTRIKTNGSLMILHGNSNANKAVVVVEPNNSPAAVIRVNNKGKVGASHTSTRFSSLSESAVMEKVSSTSSTTIMHCDNLCETVSEINNSKSGRGGGIMDHHQNGDTTNLLYRISTSTSASDSGKGSLDLDSGTNRNSTESSCLLSDSASTRNSIISHETGCSRSSSSSASLFLLPNTNNGNGEDNNNGYGSSTPAGKVNTSSEKNKVNMGASGNSNSAKSTPSSVKKYTPKMHNNNTNNNMNVHESTNNQLEDQDATSTSITLPTEFRNNNSASVSAQTNVIMVDKETDILSDWANTDDDGEDEIETDRNDDDDEDDGEYDNDDEDRVTPTPSSPDTDTGGRVMFHHSQSTSSVTDIDFGDSSAATAASSNGIAPSSSIFRAHCYTQNNVTRNCSTNKGKNGGTPLSTTPMDPYQQHHHLHNNNIVIMRPQTTTTCYTIIPPPQTQEQEQGDHRHHLVQWHESGMFGENNTRTQADESDILHDHFGLTKKSGIMCPTGHPLVGIHNAQDISLSTSPYSHVPEDDDYNANKPPNSSNAIARGALGFLRKIFKKGSCSSSHRTSPGSGDKVKIPRSAKSKDSHLDNIASITGLRSTSLLTTADALVSPHPLVGRKSSINGYFLTPTPNAFRRRSGATTSGGGGGGGTDSSDSTKGSGGSSSKQHAKSVKTDIIRLPPGALSPTSTQNANSSSSTASSKNTSIGAFCISSLQNNMYAAGNGNNNNNSNATQGCSNNTNTNSTASSIHSMSTSTSASTNGGLLLLGNGEIHANNNGHTPSTSRLQQQQQNQSRLNDNFYLNSNSNRQSSPYLSSDVRSGGPSYHHPILVGAHSNPNPVVPAQLPTLPPVPHQSPYAHHQQNGLPPTASQNHRPLPNNFQNHQQNNEQREFGNGYGHRPPSRTGCPYESPRVSNPHHRINSPSFNNYSPIHRLVVTSGAQQLLNRGGGQSNNNPSSNCASPIPHHHHHHSSESPNLPSRNNNNNNNSSGTSSNHGGHNNNNTPSSSAALIPNINRSNSLHPNHTTTTFSSPSPLINHHHSSQHPEFSSPHRPHLPPCNTFTSPSPILRNPRYQYIASSNQNSPVLNVPKRMNGSAPNHPPPPPINQLNYYHNQGQGHGGREGERGGSFPIGPSSQPPPSFSTFSPTPPPRQISQSTNNTNPFSAASPNLNHHQLHSTQVSVNPNSNQHRGGVEFEIVNSPNPNLPQNNPLSPGLLSNNRNSKLLSRSQSYQTQEQDQPEQSHPVHYYVSPVVSQQMPQPPQSETTQQRIFSHHPGPMHPTSLSFNEPPLLMRAHLYNQNVRFNNFLRNKQRTQQTPITRSTVEQFPHSESFQERIYESVDSVEEDEDEDENSNMDDKDITRLHHQNQHNNDDSMRDHQHHNPQQLQQPYYFHPNTNGVLEQLRKNRLPTAISNLETGFPFSSNHKSTTNGTEVASKSKTQQSSKSKRSKAKQPHQCDEYGAGGGESRGSSHCHQPPPPRPPVPMSFFGPNTFLSETETRLLETDEREADRKYKRLINEAESLLMEISNLNKEPWAKAQPPPSSSRMRIEDCPQSDPLRRKAYDCWALRRLQQELAGCCASPPVLHRSRMNLQSPGTPTAAAATMLNPYFSLVPNPQMANANLHPNSLHSNTHTQNNVHF